MFIFFKVIIRKKIRDHPTTYPPLTTFIQRTEKKCARSYGNKKQDRHMRNIHKKNEFTIFSFFSTNEMVMYVDDPRLPLPMVYDILDLNVHELMPNMLHNNIVNMSHLHKKMERIFHHIVHRHIHRIIDHQVHMV